MLCLVVHENKKDKHNHKNKDENKHKRVECFISFETFRFSFKSTLTTKKSTAMHTEIKVNQKSEIT